MDSDGYPEESELEEIRHWLRTDFAGLMDYVGTLWYYPDRFYTLGDGVYALSTGGWSGNESLIAALEQNRMFWACCWQLSKRGGYFEFQLPESQRR